MIARCIATAANATPGKRAGEPVEHVDLALAARPTPVATNASTTGPRSASSHDVEDRRAAHVARRAGAALAAAGLRGDVGVGVRRRLVASGIANGGSARPAARPARADASVRSVLSVM